MKLVKGWKPIRISQEVYKDVEYRRNDIKGDVVIPPGVLVEYAYLLFLKQRHSYSEKSDSYIEEMTRLEQIKRIYGLQNERF